MCQCSCGTRRCPGFCSSASKHLVMRWAVDDSFERSWTLDAWDESKWFKYIQMHSNASYRFDSSWHIMTGWSSWAHTFGLPIRYFFLGICKQVVCRDSVKDQLKSSFYDWLNLMCVCVREWGKSHFISCRGVRLLGPKKSAEAVWAKTRNIDLAWFSHSHGNIKIHSV